MFVTEEAPFCWSCDDDDDDLDVATWSSSAILSVIGPTTTTGSGSIVTTRGNSRVGNTSGATVETFVVDVGEGVGDGEGFASDSVEIEEEENEGLDGSGGGGRGRVGDDLSSGTKRKAGEFDDATLEGEDDVRGEEAREEEVTAALLLLLSSWICPGSSCASLVVIHQLDGDTHIRAATRRTRE